MSTLHELLAQQAEIAKKIGDLQRTERASAIAQVKTIMAEYGLTAADIVGKAGARDTGEAKPSKVAAKYRNAITGATWSGRGLQPRWLKTALSEGAKLEDFAI